jgi:hypothetical protein
MAGSGRRCGAAVAKERGMRKHALVLLAAIGMLGMLHAAELRVD